MKTQDYFRPLLNCICFLAIAVFASADDRLPIVPDGFVVDTVAREPMVRNPCVMVFDRLGRICVAQGPQWRGPTTETPGDRVDILIDEDNDGIADRVQTFAEGFNCIQGIAWYGDDLWIANAPDLTVVRDTDGNDEADEYIRVYTGLGNLEHSLHGLNFGPDGKLYMSKGNSRGYNRLDQLAPLAFRELWGLESPEGAPDYTDVEVFTKEDYKRAYHTPQDDWGQQGGILRCEPYGGVGVSTGTVDLRSSTVPVENASGNTQSRPRHPSYDAMGRNLEIVARGFRNPWDICFDDGFNWLGTDNDQTQGDKIFAPFYGAHFGWGHPWSYHWTGEDHLPTVPASAPLFEGSGTGVIHYHATQFPEEYRGVFFENDWMRREVYAFRPKWDGALLTCEGGFPGVFAHADGGRTLPGSSGRVFEPTDIEVGPDGTLYILSWGHAYGGTIKDGKQIDAGRVYRIRHAESTLVKWQSDHRAQPIAEWSLEELFADLGSSVPAWRTNAQNELVQRGAVAGSFLAEKLANKNLSTAEETWTMWTLGRLGVPMDLDAADLTMFSNSALQAIRIAAWQKRHLSGVAHLPQFVFDALKSPEPRLRHAAVLAIHQSGDSGCTNELLDLAACEADRITFYATWNALRHLADLESRKAWLSDRRPGVRLAALLGLFEDDAVSVDDVLLLRSDDDVRVAGLVELWLQKTGGAEPLVTFNPPPGEYSEPVAVTLTTSVPQARFNYTTDGSVPVNTSQSYSRPISIDRDTTLKVVLTQDNTQAGPVTTGEYKIRQVEPYRHRAFISDIAASASGEYRMDWIGLAPGKQHYTDRHYHITAVPPELRGLPYLQMCNQHDRSSGNQWLSMRSDSDVSVLVGVDVRVNATLGWMKIGEPDGFEDTGLELATTDPTFRIFRKQFSAGEIVLGGNTNNPQTDSGRGMYVVIFDRPLLPTQPHAMPATEADVLAAMKNADPERGRELFLHPKGAGCVKCHQMEGLGQKFAPDLSDVGSRAKKAEILIQSILAPSAVITEGFAQQQIVTIEGKVFSGAVLEESGLSLKLINSDGIPITIPKKDIEERICTKLSSMPDGFNKLMSAQQIADIVAWLMTQTVIGDREGFSFRDREDRLDISFGTQRIATYLKEHPQLTRRALVNVTTPSGIPVTRNFPPRKPEDIDPGYTAEDGIIHPNMHPGIWLSFGDVDGNDYWRLKAKVVFDGFIERPAGDRTNGNFLVRNQLMSEDGERVVCTEIARYRFEIVPGGMLIRIDAMYGSDDRDFYFGDQEESGLAIRVASPIRVHGGNGTILNSNRERNGAEVWGKEAKWFDYFGTIEGRQVGIMVVSSPNNPRPSWLHARDYGVVVTNPFPRQPKERREPYIKTWVKRGQPFRLSYAVLIHDQLNDQPLDHDAVVSRLLKSFD
jgi:putative membrane-bound dehydrogenase-like protein